MRSEGNRCVTHVKQGSLSPGRPVRQGTQLGGLWLALRTLIKLVSKLYAISQKNVVSGGIFFPAALFCVPDEVLDRLYTLSPYLKKHAFSLYSFKVTKMPKTRRLMRPILGIASKYDISSIHHHQNSVQNAISFTVSGTICHPPDHPLAPPAKTPADNLLPKNRLAF